MAVQARVTVIENVEKIFGSGWKLCFQWCIYNYSDGTQQRGYRFIWKRKDGSLQAARGQARLPNMALITELVEKAKKQGWGYEGEEMADSNVLAIFHSNTCYGGFFLGCRKRSGIPNKSPT